MDIFENLKQKSPSLIIFAVIVSTLYNVGFFTAAGRADLITNLTYQDILITSIFAIAIIIPAFLIVEGIQRGVHNGINLNNKYKKFIYIVALLAGFAIIFTAPYDFVGWAILTILLTPLAPNFFKKFQISLQKETIADIAIFFTISIASFGNGYGYYKAQICSGQQYYYDSEKKYLLLKIYSNFLVLHKSDNEIQIIPNNHSFSIVTDPTEAEEKLLTRKCNPILNWMKDIPKWRVVDMSQ